jgi:hypothetical protein
MKQFTLIGILAAAKCFGRQEGANEALEEDLRGIESTKQAKAAEEITTVDTGSLYSAFATLVASHCVGNMVSAVLEKYTELGHEVIQ